MVILISTAFPAIDEDEQYSKDRMGLLVRASLLIEFMADLCTVSSLTATDALAIAEVDLPPGGLPGLEKVN